MSGAAVLAGLGAIHGGTGKLTIATPQCVFSIVAARNPCWMTIPLAESTNDDGFLSTNASDWPTIHAACQRQTAVAIGPGLGQSGDVRIIAENLFQLCEQPVVFDADALNVLAVSDVWRNRQLSTARIFTPHLGEFARLTGMSIDDINANRESVAAEFALQHGLIVLLKGHHSIVTDGEKMAVNETGNAALATGGTGDVLTGLVVSLLAQGMEPFDAAQLAAYLHGLSAELLLPRYATPFITAEMIATGLSAAWRHLETEKA